LVSAPNRQPGSDDPVIEHLSFGELICLLFVIGMVIEGIILAFRRGRD